MCPFWPFQNSWQFKQDRWCVVNCWKWIALHNCWQCIKSCHLKSEELLIRLRVQNLSKMFLTKMLWLKTRFISSWASGHPASSTKVSILSRSQLLYLRMNLPFCVTTNYYKKIIFFSLWRQEIGLVPSYEFLFISFHKYMAKVANFFAVRKSSIFLPAKSYMWRWKQRTAKCAAK